MNESGNRLERILCPTIAARASHQSNNDASNSLISLPNELLKKILEKVDDPDNLLVCRLVNKTWKDFCNEILIHRRDLRLGFRYNRNLGEFSSEWDHSKSRTLEHFNNCLRNSIGVFPCCKFNLFRGDLSHPHVEEFFRLHGHHIKDIFFDFESRKIDPFTKLYYIKNILRMIPNVEHLSVEGSATQWKSNTSLIPSSTSSFTHSNSNTSNTSSNKDDDGVKLLNSLKTVYFMDMDLNDGSLSVQSDILEASPQLESISGVDIRLIDFIISSNRLQCVTDFSIEPNKDSDIDFYEKLIPASPKFKQLCMILEHVFQHTNSQLRHRLSKVLSAVLESSKESLEELELRYPIGMAILPSIILPQMKSVKKIHLSVVFIPEEFPDNINNNIVAAADVDDVDDGDENGNEHGKDEYLMIPKNYSIAQTFPNLHHLALFCFQLADEDLLERSFPFLVNKVNAVPSVKQLEITRMSSAIWMKKIQKVFPKIETLNMTELEDFPDVAEIIWKWTHLKHVEIEIMVHERKCPRNTFPFLDAAISGFTENDCGKLECPGRRVNNIFPVNSSILNLTELKTFRMYFYGDYNLSPAQIPHKLLSRISQRYAFKLMRNNNVQVEIATRCRNQEIAKIISEALKPVQVDP